MGLLEASAEHYATAVALAPECRGLVTEYLQLLLELGQFQEVLDVISGLPQEVAEHGRTHLVAATARAAIGDRDGATVLLTTIEVANLAEGDTSIGDLWLQLHPNTAIPHNLDFAMTSSP